LISTLEGSQHGCKQFSLTLGQIPNRRSAGEKRGDSSLIRSKPAIVGSTPTGAFFSMNAKSSKALKGSAKALNCPIERLRQIPDKSPEGAHVSRRR